MSTHTGKRCDAALDHRACVRRGSLVNKTPLQTDYFATNLVVMLFTAVLIKPLFCSAVMVLVKADIGLTKSPGQSSWLEGPGGGLPEMPYWQRCGPGELTPMLSAPAHNMKHVASDSFDFPAHHGLNKRKHRKRL